jgi:hypothetical protein
VARDNTVGGGRRQAAVAGCGVQGGNSRDDIRRELVLDKGDAVAEVELALLEPLHLQEVRAGRRLQGKDGGVEVAVLLLQPRQLLPQLAFFLFGHRYRWFRAGLRPPS